MLTMFLTTLLLGASAPSPSEEGKSTSLVPALGGKDDKKPDQKEEKELKVLSRGLWGAPVQVGKQQQLVIRSAKELIEATGATGENAEKQTLERLTKSLKVDKIDWKTQMVVIVSGGVKPTGGYSVEVTGLKVKDKTLTVHWKLNSPKPGSFVTQIVTHPAQAVLVERFDGTVRFDPPAAKKEK
jgi:hypothetical protein